MRKNLIAAIDIGSRAVRMKIGELNKKGDFRELDSFSRAMPLGHETFLNKKIGFKTVDMLCEVLRNYKQIIDEYKIKNYSLIATSAIREAKNKDYILDQIKIRTGFKVEVVDNSEEQFITLKAIRLNLENFETLTEEGLIVVGIGGGSIQLTAYKNGNLTSNTNLKLGALRIKEVLEPIKENNIRYRDVLKEYISLYISRLDEINNKKYTHLVVVGGEIDLIRELTSGTDEILTKKDILKIYRDIEDLSDAEIVSKYNIENERAGVLFPSLVLLKQFIKSVDGEEIIAPKLSLVDGIIRNIYESIYSRSLDDSTIRDILASAKNLSIAYGASEEHFDYVDDVSMQIFKKLAAVHGLKKELLLLRLAAILSDLGASMNISDYGENTYELVRMLDVFGMSSENMEMLALVSKFSGALVPDNTDVDFKTLPDEKHITVAKLIAMLKLARSMDICSKQKIKIKTVKLKDKLLIIKGDSKADTSLEEWDFASKSAYFKEVFGIDTKLIIKKEF